MTERKEMKKLVSKGCLKIGNEEDRRAIAALLFKNGYTVSTVRCKKNEKTFEYFVKYELVGTEKGVDVTEAEVGYEQG